jgi:hypothetical protein
MRRMIVLALTVAFIAFTAAAGPASAGDAGCATYGTGVTLESATPVAALAAAPEEWAGKTVRVEGEVREVCPRAGCWLSIVSTDGTAPLRVKVEDGEIVFPLSARGHHAAAQGVVEVHDMTREQYAGWLEHLAEEKDEPFDPATVGEGPYRQVQVKAVGAKVCDDEG